MISKTFPIYWVSRDTPFSYWGGAENTSLINIIAHLTNPNTFLSVRAKRWSLREAALESTSWLRLGRQYEDMKRLLTGTRSTNGRLEFFGVFPNSRAGQISNLLNHYIAMICYNSPYSVFVAATDIFWRLVNYWKNKEDEHVSSISVSQAAISQGKL
jgi:hypothetical protein